MTDLTSSLVLGTAQLGFPYGIANRTGQPDQHTATEIIRTAWACGIREFDTAQDYGISEQVLGNALDTLGHAAEAKIVSKFDPSLDHLDSDVLNRAVRKSLARLRVPQLHIMMLHDETQLSLWDQGLARIVNGICEAGLVRHAGVSVYSPEKATEALQTEGIDAIQVPTNMLDRRFSDAGIFQLASDRKKKVYIRSVFLQGLLLMDPFSLPDHMTFAQPVIHRLSELSHEFSLTRQEMALGYLAETLPQAQLVVGVETPEQLKENASFQKTRLPVALLTRIKSGFAQVNEKVLNPMYWSF